MQRLVITWVINNSKKVLIDIPISWRFPSAALVTSGCTKSLLKWIPKTSELYSSIALETFFRLLARRRLLSEGISPRILDTHSIQIKLNIVKSLLIEVFNLVNKMIFRMKCFSPELKCVESIRCRTFAIATPSLTSFQLFKSDWEEFWDLKVDSHFKRASVICAVIFNVMKKTSTCEILLLITGFNFQWQWETFKIVTRNVFKIA